VVFVGLRAFIPRYVEPFYCLAGNFFIDRNNMKQRAKEKRKPQFFKLSGD
jgi:hypothetical protein